jgi:hypothetical protein
MSGENLLVENDVKSLFKKFDTDEFDINTKYQ